MVNKSIIVLTVIFLIATIYYSPFWILDKYAYKTETNKSHFQHLVEIKVGICYNYENRNTIEIQGI
jgi:hypothetical protein